jgi:hypothetical protein
MAQLLWGRSVPADQEFFRGLSDQFLDPKNKE